jgi:hypothetical protein
MPFSHFLLPWRSCVKSLVRTRSRNLPVHLPRNVSLPARSIRCGVKQHPFGSFPLSPVSSNEFNHHLSAAMRAVSEPLTASPLSARSPRPRAVPGWPSHPHACARDAARPQPAARTSARSDWCGAANYAGLAPRTGNRRRRAWCG